MKNMILKGLAGIVAAVMIALAYHPISAQAAGEPQVSLTSAYYVNETTKFVLLNNNGSLGDQVNNYYWNIYEKAVDNDFGTVCLEYSESRKGISDPVYVNTDRFRFNAPVTLTIIADCPALGYSYTVNYTICNDKHIGASFSVVPAASAILYNGGASETLDGYVCPMGDLAKAVVKAFMPVGYMPACEGALSFNYKLDYLNKNGLVCFTIPQGALASNRTYKLMTLGQGGVISVYDDLDLNPGTITANVNFNGYAVALIYTETGAAPVAVPASAAVTPLPAGSGAAVAPSMIVLSNYSFEERPQGSACMTAFSIMTPAGYRAVKTYSLFVNGTASASPKNGLVTIGVPAGYTSFKLLTVDNTGAVQVLDDIDNAAGTATFALNFNGYAVQLIGR